MSKLSKIDRELRKYVQLSIEAEQNVEHDIELVANIETLLSPTSAQRMSYSWDAFVRLTHQVVADYFPALPIDIGHSDLLATPTPASSLGVITLMVTVPRGTCVISVALSPHLSTTAPQPAGSVTNIHAGNLQATFHSHLYDHDGDPLPGDNPFVDWSQSLTCDMSTLLDPVQYADYLTAMLPGYQSQWLDERVARAQAIVGVELCL